MADKRVRFGVMGAGGIARRKTIPGMLKADNIEVVAVMDPNQVEAIAKQFGVAHAYTTQEQLLADPAVEAVYIASPVHCHARQIAMAAEAGKHILCEKPLTMTLQEAQSAVQACQRHGVFLQEGYMMKFHGAHTKTHQLIADGRLGQIVSMRAQLSCWYPRIEGAWRQDPSTGGGGALIDMATHLYDLLMYFAGPVRRIGAYASNLVQDYVCEDASTSWLEFASGAHATVDCFFCIPDEASRTRLEIYGSQGAILTEGTIGQSTGGTMEGIFGLGNADYDSQQNKDVARQFQSISFEAIDPYAAQCAYFAQCIRTGRPPAINDAANALCVMAMVEKAYESARTGQIVSV